MLREVRNAMGWGFGKLLETFRKFLEVELT